MQSFLARADQAELKVCLKINALSRSGVIRQGFRIVSRLGDGVLWYSSMVVFALLGGVDGTKAMLHVGLTSLVGVYLYSYLKNRLVRPRPYVSHGQIVCAIAPLDQYSFPSGHTLHAVLFTTMFAAYEPTTLWLFLPFTLLVALSRIVLGLHYPSDVLVGGILGVLLAALSLAGVGTMPVELAADWTSVLELWSP
ncbi:MAG: phosphatase PAP2 family protein [Pseudomonadota bacterium]